MPLLGTKETCKIQTFPVIEQMEHVIYDDWITTEKFPTPKNLCGTPVERELIKNEQTNQGTLA